MLQAFSLANARIALALNHALYGHLALYKIALFLTDQAAGVLVVLTLLAVWFLPGRVSGKAENINPAPSPQPEDETVPVDGPRLKSRARVIAFAFATLVTIIVAWLLAERFNVDRSFASFLPIRGTGQAFNGLRLYGPFPSYYAAFLGALTTMLFGWNRGLGWVWAALSFLLCLMRVAIGYDYPFDVVGGVCIGALSATLMLRHYEQAGVVQKVIDDVARGFEPKDPPYHYVLYAFSLLVFFEFGALLSNG